MARADELVLAPFVERERERIVATLFEWLRIPSISAQPAHAADVRRSAEFTAELMRAAGLEHVAVIDAGGAPAVYGDHLHAAADAPTALVYGHHDVQPVDPLDAWTSPPFEPTIVDGECRARGAIDDKGQVLYELEAVHGWLERDEGLPVNVRFLVEGEEEIGSPHFEALRSTSSCVRRSTTSTPASTAAQCRTPRTMSPASSTRCTMPPGG
jgi:acetylornithine deacetylase/succinyl-diaminopimelate desuccinylase-like protein